MIQPGDKLAEVLATQRRAEMLNAAAQDRLAAAITTGRPGRLDRFRTSIGDALITAGSALKQGRPVRRDWEHTAG